MVGSLPVLNLAEARYECTFGRGCDGICCRRGRPSLYPEEMKRIDENLRKFLPHLKPAARTAIAKKGIVSQRRKLGMPVVRVVNGWCVFFNKGCVLHKIGAEEGDKFLYKPSMCALFPLSRDENGDWYVRQQGYKEEIWDLFCLNPEASPLPAAESLRDEIALAEAYSREETVSSPSRSISPEPLPVPS